MFGLIDCNNFFASCERVFNPALRNRPVVVLSNNDGCVIARSNEAKLLGIPMGAPYFKIRHLTEQYGITVFSSNYSLYGDMSRRVMSLLAERVPDLMIYSIDEAFADLAGIGDGETLHEFGRQLVREIGRGTGIPVTMGIASTKTLAKTAGYFGKRYPAYQGVCLIDTEEKRQKALRLFPIGEVWGIGRRCRPRLEAAGIRTAWDFVNRSESWVRRELTVNGVRVWRELQGFSCIERDDMPQKKSICTSRSFEGEGLSRREHVEEAIANFAASCSRKLRQQHSVCTGVTVFAYTSRFRTDVEPHSLVHNVVLQVPTNDQRELIGHCLQALRTEWVKDGGYLYKKAGVVVWGLTDDTAVQTALFDTVDRTKQAALAKAIDAIKLKNGPEAVRVAVQGTAGYAFLKREHLSPRYTTDLRDIITVRTDK